MSQISLRLWKLCQIKQCVYFYNTKSHPFNHGIKGLTVVSSATARRKFSGVIQKASWVFTYLGSMFSLYSKWEDLSSQKDFLSLSQLNGQRKTWSVSIGRMEKQKTQVRVTELQIIQSFSASRSKDSYVALRMKTIYSLRFSF